MEKTYSALIDRIAQKYREHLAIMFYWDARCDREPDNEIALRIRNDAAKTSSTLLDLLVDDGIAAEKIESIRNAARADAERM